VTATANPLVKAHNSQIINHLCEMNTIKEKYKLLEKPLIKIPNNFPRMSDRVEFVRCIFGFPLKSFANHLGTSLNTVTMVCKGEKQPNIRLLNVICEAFPVNKSWLAFNEGSDQVVTVKDYSSYIYQGGKTKQDQIDEELVKRFILLRVEAGLTQHQLALKVKTSYDVIKGFEAKRTGIPIPLFKKLIEFYGIPDEFALWGTGPQVKSHHRKR
jgi:transcriptional regulator with XRE-family HTH domain